MSDFLFVQIDLFRLRENLIAAGDQVDEADTLDFLARSGFRASSEPGWWLCEQIQFDMLDRSEIIAYRRLR